MLVEVELSGAAVQVDGLDDEAVLDLIGDCEAQTRQGERRKLRYALAWAGRHVVSEAEEAARWTDADYRDIEETLGGEGTPLIKAGCVEPFATALGVSTRTGMQLLSDGLDLVHRLPLIHRGVEELRIAPWRARRIASATHRLSVQAAAYVDARLAPIADSCGVVRIDRLVDEATARFDEVEQARLEDEAKAAWGMRLDHYAGLVWAGTSRLEFTGDTATLTRFADLVRATAHHLLDPTLPAKDQPSLGQRQITALGVIADGDTVTCHTMAYLHLHASDIVDLPDQPTRLGNVERLGPLTIDRIRDWLRTATDRPGKLTIQPVLDLARPDAVDRHDPPRWMRDLVIVRDQRCVFPYCNKPARDCDLDHIEAYLEIDNGGPPGQTHPGNLAALCRRHHRAKTHRGWSYVRNRDRTYTWTGPRGHRYTVDPRGIITRH